MTIVVVFSNTHLCIKGNIFISIQWLFCVLFLFFVYEVLLFLAALWCAQCIIFVFMVFTLHIPSCYVRMLPTYSRLFICYFALFAVWALKQTHLLHLHFVIRIFVYLLAFCFITLLVETRSQNAIAQFVEVFLLRDFVFVLNFWWSLLWQAYMIVCLLHLYLVL